MSMQKKKAEFFNSDEGNEIKSILIRMASDSAYHTEATYSADKDTYPDNLKPFVNFHMDYLSAHPATDRMQYLANLRLRTRLR